jgi:hypothetical protein
VLELDTRDDHNHNASNHGHGSAATYYWRADDYHNDARGHRRLLIAKAGRAASVVGTTLWAVAAFKKAVLNSIGHVRASDGLSYGEPVATVENTAQDF